MEVELRRRRSRKKKRRDPNKVPVRELHSKQIERLLREGRGSKKRLQQLRQEQRHRTSGFYKARVVSGGLPGLGRRR
jgi:hypothetical protein